MFSSYAGRSTTYVINYAVTKTNLNEMVLIIYPLLANTEFSSTFQFPGGFNWGSYSVLIIQWVPTDLLCCTLIIPAIAHFASSHVEKYLRYYFEFLQHICDLINFSADCFCFMKLKYVKNNKMPAISWLLINEQLYFNLE